MFKQPNSYGLKQTDTVLHGERIIELEFIVNSSSLLKTVRNGREKLAESGETRSSQRSDSEFAFVTAPVISKEWSCDQ